jgi:NTE family protein
MNAIHRTYIKFKNRSTFLMAQLNRQENPPLYHYPYKNMVFKGGGIRGLAYCGALEVLENRGILMQIERVAGTSAGAITAALLSLRLTHREIMNLFSSLDYSKVPQVHTVQTRSVEIMNALGLRNGELACTSRLINEFGWYSSQYFYDWMQAVVAQHCGGDGRATFADFHKKGFRELHIVAANISKYRSEVFSYETTPTVAVADAVRMSISIPFFFQALRFDGSQFGQGDYYVDGGLYDNFPIRIFDAPEYSRDNPWYIKGVNWQTLGCYLYPELSPQDMEKDPQSLREYLELTVDNLFDSFQKANYERNSLDQKRTIKINDCGVSPIRFDIPVGSATYMNLIESGRSSANQFLDVDYPKEVFV